MIRIPILASALFTFLISTAVAGPRSSVEWLATFEIAPGGSVAVWTLVDSFALWPSAYDTRARRAAEAGCYEDARYMFANKGDYVRAILYLSEGSSVSFQPETRVVFAYPDRCVEMIEILAPTARRDDVRTSSRGLLFADPSELMRSTDGGFRIYIRFAPGSLPRPGGNHWGIARPDSCYVQGREP